MFHFLFYLTSPRHLTLTFSFFSKTCSLRCWQHITFSFTGLYPVSSPPSENSDQTSQGQSLALCPSCASKAEAQNSVFTSQEEPFVFSLHTSNSNKSTVATTCFSCCKMSLVSQNSKLLKSADRAHSL